MYLVVGAGLSGCVVAERLASQRNEQIVIIDRREHLGGNVYDYQDENGIIIHKYGPHIFHTNYKKVWDYLSQFTEWHYYYHRVKAIVEGSETVLPFNFDSIYSCFPPQMAARLENKLLDYFAYGEKIPILEIAKRDDNDLKFLADYVYQHVYLGYTAKQWGLKPEELEETVTARVPLHLSRDDRYFQDRYQGIPLHGYTNMVENIVNHPNIEVRLNTDFWDMETQDFEKVIFTGKIDEYYRYQFGTLSYRSLRFDFRTIDRPFYQSLAQVNYPNEYDFTRITEFKHFFKQQTRKTCIAIEYPEEYIIGENEPYYPLLTNQNKARYDRYQALNKKDPDTILLGRLAEYEYLNMDQAVAKALHMVETDQI